MNRKYTSALIRTARSRLDLASDVIAESRHRIAVFDGKAKKTGTRVAVIAPERKHSMADDLGKRGSPDRERINVNEDYEVRDWAKKLGVSPDDLKRAVQQVGDRADAVRQHLGK
jgi:Protein of unknown function (DUF3606)